MSLHVRERLQRVPQLIKNKLVPGGIILLYHRVTNLPSDPHLLSVTPQQFAEHLEVIKKYGNPMPLKRLVKLLSEGKRPNKAVVITFDDGYADNLLEAKPILEKYDIPATVYVTTGHIEYNQEFWWDELDRLLLQSGPTLPNALNIKVGKKDYQWEFGPLSSYSHEDYQRYLNWNVLNTDFPTSRHKNFCSLHKFIKTLSVQERNNVIEQLRTFIGTEPTARSTHRTLTEKEVIELDKGGLIEVGAHTVTHSVLSVIPVEEQRYEIQESKKRLEEILGRTVDSFAYPFGGRADYTSDTVKIAKEAGFTSSCSNFFGIVRRDTSLFELPRMMVGDSHLAPNPWDGNTLARMLRYHAFG
jgi:peptidoglycan/xylan/chitin deacetylase (PgdA/CDA1 family)